MRDYKVSSDVCSSDLRDVLQKQLEALKARTSSDSVQHRLLDQIEDISTQKLRELQETIDLRKAGDLDAAMALVRLDVGKNAMDRLRELIDDLYTRQTRELEQRRQLWVEASTTSTYYSWGGSLILLGLILASAALTRGAGFGYLGSRPRRAWLRSAT